MRSYVLVLPLVFVACGGPPPAPSVPSEPVQEPPVLVEVEPSTVVEMALDTSGSWLEVTGTDRNKSGRATPSLLGGRVVLETLATGWVVSSIELDLDDLSVEGAHGVPGVALTSMHMTIVPHDHDRAKLRLDWALRDAAGDVRQLRAVEVSSIRFHPTLANTGRGLVLTAEGGGDGRLWALEGWFEMSDLAFGLIAVEVTD